MILAGDAGGGPHHTIGSALADGDLPSTAVRAVLKAVNRRLERQLPEAGTTGHRSQTSPGSTSTEGSPVSDIRESVTLVKGYLDLMLAHLGTLDIDQQRDLLQGAVFGAQRLVANLDTFNLPDSPAGAMHGLA